MSPNNYRRQSGSVGEWNCFRKLTGRDLDLVAQRSESFR